METLQTIISGYISALLTTYQISKKKANEVFNTTQLNGYDAKAIKYISINVPPMHICRQKAINCKSFLHISLPIVKDGRLRKLQNIVVKRIVQEILKKNNSIIIVLQSDRFLYLCESVSIELMKSCKIIQLSNNNIKDTTTFINNFHYAEQQLGYNKSYNFISGKFDEVWQDNDECSNNSCATNVKSPNSTASEDWQVLDD